MPARPARYIRLVREPDEIGVGVLCITVNSRSHYYTFCEIPCDIGGRGFRLHRLGLGNVYDVRIDESNDSSCECMGFLRHGRCKHVHGLRALLAHGLL